MTDTSSMLRTDSPPVYSREELMSQLGLAPAEIDASLAQPKGPEAIRATLSTISIYLRSIFDLEQDRAVSFLKRHNQIFDGAPLAVMLGEEDGVDRVQRYFAGEVYSTW